ncbi:Retrovirus-related Pol polyprotein from transposon RE2 [Bienertia sinuspersici]
MFHNLNLFDDYEPVNTLDNGITLPDGRQVKIMHIGSVPLPSGIKLKGVFYVLDFQFNLISIHKLCHNMSYEVKFTAGSCLIQGATLTHHQALGKVDQGLYCTKAPLASISAYASLDHPTSHDLGCSLTVQTDVTDAIEIWHLRLGHISFPQVNKVANLHVDISSLDCFCQVCLATRQTRLPFSCSSIKTCVHFSLIHVDIWGPYRVSTHNNCRYFLTIVYDYSRHTWVHFLK